MKYTDEVFLKENKNTKTLPAYIREYKNFFRLIKIFSNYIQNAVDIIEDIISKFRLSSSSGDVLSKIAQRLDIYIEKPINEEGEVDEELYNQQLKIAILGNGLKRTSLANRDSLSQILNVFSSIRSCEITDYGITSSQDTSRMFIHLYIVGKNDVWTTEILEKYVFPNITGVGIVARYKLDNNIYFGFDIQNRLLGYIDLSTGAVTLSALNERAKEILSGADLVDGMSLIDNDNACWMCYTTENNTKSWANVGAVSIMGDTVIDPITNTAIRGWDEGYWIEENPLTEK